MAKPKLTYIWHFYHNQLATSIFYSAPIKKRRLQIKANKPFSEHGIRLKLLKVVKGKLPDRIIKLGWKAFHEGRRYELSCEKVIIKLHKKECKNCPWDGNTMFPFPVTITNCTGGQDN